MAQVFENIDELYDVMEELWNWIKTHEGVSDKLLESRLVVQFRYRRPEGVMTIDGSDGTDLKIIFGPCAKQPNVQMTMDSDLAHKFWMGKMNVPMALVSGQIVSKGPVNKALALLPAVKPAHKVYPDIAARSGKAA